MIITLTSKHYRPYLSLIYNKYIGSESVHSDATPIFFLDEEGEEEERPPGRVVQIENGSLSNGFNAAVAGGISPGRVSCLLSSYSAEFSIPRRRESNIAWPSIRDIRGEDLPHFKGKLDRVLSHYPDVPRCGTSGYSYSELKLYIFNYWGVR